MKFYILLLIVALLNSANGKALHERKRRVAGNDNYYEDLDKPVDNDADDFYGEDGDYEYDEDYDDYGEMFACFEGSVEIAISLLCDGFHDCADGSDEVIANCEEHGKTLPTTTTTSTTTTTTTTAQTLPPVEPKISKPEDYDDYGDACSEEEYQCVSDVSICLPKSQVCDGIHDCPDKEDEENCNEHTLKTTTTAKTPLPILEGDEDNRTSAERKQRLPSNITEISCSSIHAFQCRSRPGDCVPRELLCDGFHDCPDGSDEERCSCKTGEFACMSGKCIDATTRCDGTDDCGDFSDEILGCVLFLSEDYEFDKTSNNEEIVETPEISTTLKSLEVNITEEKAIENGTYFKHTGNKTNKSGTLDEDTKPTLVSNNDFYFQICDYDPCANEGECHDNEDSFTCVCKPGFTGPTCLQKCKNGETGCNTATHTKSFRTSYLTILTFFVFFIFSS